MPQARITGELENTTSGFWFDRSRMALSSCLRDGWGDLFMHDFFCFHTSEARLDTAVIQPGTLPVVAYLIVVCL